MEPIVSPWLIWLIGIVDGVGVALTLLSSMLFFVSLISGVFYFHARAERIDTTRNTAKPIVLLSTILAFLMLMVACLLPSSKTLTAMIVASQVTPDNIQTTIDAGKNFKDEIKTDIIDILTQSQKYEK